MLKKNKFIILLIGLIIIAALAGIFLYNKEHDVEKKTKTVQGLEQIGYDELEKKLKEAELDITTTSDNENCNAIGAKDGKTYVIHDKVVQVYRFDLKSEDELTKSNIKLAEGEGKILMPSFNNIEIAVMYNKGMVLMELEDHPDKEKIKEIFLNL